MTAPVEASVPTVQPSAPVLDDAEMAVVQAAISDPSTKLVEGLVEGQLYQMINGRFVECELTHLGSVGFLSSKHIRPNLNPLIKTLLCLEDIFFTGENLCFSISMRHTPMCGFVGVTTECNMPSFLLLIPLNHMPPSLSMNIFVSSPTAVIFLISISIEDWHAIPSL